LSSAIKKAALSVITVLVLSAVSFNYLFLTSLSGVPVLNYHQINDEAHNVLTLSSKEFDAQMAYLQKAGYTTISPDQLLDYFQNGKELPPNPILITFDDGYEDNYRVAYPILQKYNFTATIFVITDFVGHNGRFLTWKQIKEMHNNGFAIQSHTLNHQSLANASDADILAQLIKSREALEWRLKQKVEYLAYPGGIYDKRVIELTKQAGYRAAFTVNVGRDTKKCGIFTLNRIPIFAANHTFLHFWLRLKFTQIVITLQNFKEILNHFGATKVANWVFVP
jgi:peptidoglycan/xylan/chitin deacetylase (PgdA/CDA1 family)